MTKTVIMKEKIKTSLLEQTSKYPSSIKILGITYKIEYVANASEVDIHKRRSLWGQIDFWTRTIRVFSDKREKFDLWQTLLHEIIHGIISSLSLEKFIKTDTDVEDTTEEDLVDLLSLGILNVLVENKLDFSDFQKE